MIDHLDLSARLSTLVGDEPPFRTSSARAIDSAVRSGRAYRARVVLARGVAVCATVVAVSGVATVAIHERPVTGARTGAGVASPAGGAEGSAPAGDGPGSSFATQRATLERVKKLALALSEPTHGQPRTTDLEIRDTSDAMAADAPHLPTAAVKSPTYSASARVDLGSAGGFELSAALRPTGPEISIDGVARLCFAARNGRDQPGVSCTGFPGTTITGWQWCGSRPGRVDPAGSCPAVSSSAHVGAFLTAYGAATGMPGRQDLSVIISTDAGRAVTVDITNYNVRSDDAKARKVIGPHIAARGITVDTITRAVELSGLLAPPSGS